MTTTVFFFFRSSDEILIRCHELLMHSNEIGVFLTRRRPCSWGTRRRTKATSKKKIRSKILFLYKKTKIIFYIKSLTKCFG
jgi:hypothetical protein